MANYHILQADRYGNSYTVVMHFPVPDAENEVGTNYRTAIVEYQGGAPIKSVLPNPGTEQAQLDAGELYEQVYTFNSNPTETLLEKRGRLDEMFNDNRADVQGDLAKILGYWGYSRDVP